MLGSSLVKSVLPGSAKPEGEAGPCVQTYFCPWLPHLLPSSSAKSSLVPVLSSLTSCLLVTNPMFCLLYSPGWVLAVTWHLVSSYNQWPPCPLPLLSLPASFQHTLTVSSPMAGPFQHTMVMVDITEKFSKTPSLPGSFCALYTFGGIKADSFCPL